MRGKLKEKFTNNDKLLQETYVALFLHKQLVLHGHGKSN